ncbi:WGR domain-containing protein [Acuticoccus mangrovi]|uniref:WGR domain-containing protein n=1 Tax=Acuticoccus mangrovi TaxID=2796142 RepID=A0A934ILQ7_9HYPH|nr:WGR domain-containing protein [Acuticoccus mangrovi]MBJ3776132.1 WGR domain-containing protein [Acuticoccus mangrovi]
MMQLDLFPMELHLRCIEPGKNKYRFYALSVQPTLFGEWVLVREWGRIGRAGRRRHDHYRAAGPACDALHALAQQKKRRGYRG